MTVFLFRKLHQRFGKLLAAQQVEMQVTNALATVLAAVVDDAVAVGQTLGCGDLGDRFKDLCNQVTVGAVNFVGAADVHLGNDQNVNGREGLNVAEGVDPFVLVNTGRGDLPGDDFAKNTIHCIKTSFPPSFSANKYSISQKPRLVNGF